MVVMSTILFQGSVRLLDCLAHLNKWKKSLDTPSPEGHPACVHGSEVLPDSEMAVLGCCQSNIPGVSDTLGNKFGGAYVPILDETLGGQAGNYFGIYPER